MRESTLTALHERRGVRRARRPDPFSQFMCRTRRALRRTRHRFSRDRTVGSRSKSNGTSSRVPVSMAFARVRLARGLPVIGAFDQTERARTLAVGRGAAWAGSPSPAQRRLTGFHCRSGWSRTGAQGTCCTSQAVTATEAQRHVACAVAAARTAEAGRSSFALDETGPRTGRGTGVRVVRRSC